MQTYTYPTRRQYNAALRLVLRSGLDYEAQPEELTLIVDSPGSRLHALLLALF